MSRAVWFEWSEPGVMVPLPREMRQCDRLFCVGERYRLIEEEERSLVSHRQFFAVIHSAWQNLPELTAQEFESEDELRYFVTIKAGFSEKSQAVFDTPQEAQDARDRTIGLIRKVGYAIVVVEGCVLTVHTPVSLKMRGEGAIGHKQFQKLKERAFEILAQMTSTTVDDLVKNSAEAA
jgi:hypothetical protein